MISGEELSDISRDPQVSVPAGLVSGYATYLLVTLALNGFSYDLTFYYKLVLFRSATQAEPFLR